MCGRALRKSHPRGPLLAQISQSKPHHRRAADDSLAAKKPQASNVIRLEIERVIRGTGQAATSAPSSVTVGNLKLMSSSLGPGLS